MNKPQVFLIYPGHPLWDAMIAFAQNCSWRAGPVLAKRMRENAFRPWERVIVAVMDGHVAGYCTLTETDELPEPCPYSPFIGFVFVDERCRGQRLSERMIERALLYAKEAGYPAVYLMSGERGLYEKYGFEKIGDFETIYGTTDQLFRRAT
ncbi:MAG: GNAT family N-acetyltransferase [Clostridia bacterium]|nr:GNAT family N-acetyltransferase [Clostridia bacterium]